MKGQLGTLVFVVAICCMTNAQDKCDSMQLDQCGYMLSSLIYNPDKIPTSAKGVEELCSDIKSGERCLQNKLKECPNMISSAIASEFMSKTLTHNEIVCKPGGDQMGHASALVKHGACLRRAFGSSQCTDNFLNGVEASTLEAKEEQLLSSCCAIAKFSDCVYLASRRTCGAAAANAYRATYMHLGGFMADLCTPRLPDSVNQCKTRALTPLPAGHRKPVSAVPGYVVTTKNTLGN